MDHDYNHYIIAIEIFCDQILSILNIRKTLRKIPSQITSSLQYFIFELSSASLNWWAKGSIRKPIIAMLTQSYSI